ncbi:MAG: hypothetical protein AAF770_02855 [Bacteroidota bacterium]
MFKLILTKYNNVIMRDDKTNRIYVVLGKNLQCITGKKIDNHGLAFKLSHSLPPTLQVRGDLARSVNAAQKLIMERRNQ